MKVCINCGTKNNQNASYCNNCGSELAIDKIDSIDTSRFETNENIIESRDSIFNKTNGFILILLLVICFFWYKSYLKEMEAIANKPIEFNGGQQVIDVSRTITISTPVSKEKSYEMHDDRYYKQREKKRYIDITKTFNVTKKQKEQLLKKPTELIINVNGKEIRYKTY